MSADQLNKLKSIPACSAWNPAIPNGFGYRPSLPAGIVFTALFSVSLGLYIWQTIRHKKYWLGAAFSIGTLGEVVGWGARLAAHPCPYSTPLMEMQLAALIMAPALTAAGIYGILTLVVPVIGRDKSLLRPRSYLIIFMVVDFFSGALQGIGGGMTAAAFGNGTDTQPGTYTMVAGVVWQLVSNCVFVTLFEWVILRARHTIWGNPYLIKVFAATLFAVTCMVIRGVYRSMELLEGWQGYLFIHERFALALDGAMMFLASAVFNLWNSGFLIPQAASYEDTKVPIQQEVESAQRRDLDA